MERVGRGSRGGKKGSEGKDSGNPKRYHRLED